MIIIISDIKKDFEETKKYNVMYTNNICDIKLIEDKENIIILLKNIDHEGAIDNKYLFEEILISINVTIVISNCINSKLEEICNYYKVSLFSIFY